MPVLESLAANDETLGSENNVQAGEQPQPDGNQSTASTPSPHLHSRRSGPSSHPQPAPLRRVQSFYTPYMEDRLLRRLKFFFMGPHEKIKAKRKCPWKLIIQVLKILLVTIQVTF